MTAITDWIILGLFAMVCLVPSLPGAIYVGLVGIIFTAVIGAIARKWWEFD